MSNGYFPVPHAAVVGDIVAVGTALGHSFLADYAPEIGAIASICSIIYLVSRFIYWIASLSDKDKE